MNERANQESILSNHSQFDESFSSNVSGNSDDDESPLVSMARLLRRNKKDAKKESKKSEKKSKKSSSRRSTKEKNSQHTSSESSLMEEEFEPSTGGGVIKDSPGKLKDLKEKWEQQAAENQRGLPQATTKEEEEEESGRLNVRKRLDLWEHRVSENSPSNGASPQSPGISSRKAKNSRDSSSLRNKNVERDHSLETTTPPPPPKRDELMDAFLSLAFAAFLIGIAMLIHQPYGPLFEDGAFGVFPTMDWVMGKFDAIGGYMENCTKVISDLLDKWSSNGLEASKPPSVPSDARHFLLL